MNERRSKYVQFCALNKKPSYSSDKYNKLQHIKKIKDNLFQKDDKGPQLISKVDDRLSNNHEHEGKTTDESAIQQKHIDAEFESIVIDPVDHQIFHKNRVKPIFSYRNSSPTGTIGYDSSVDKSVTSNFPAKQSFYKVPNDLTKSNTIKELKKKSVDVFKRSVKALEELKSNKEMDPLEFRYSNLVFTKGTFYQKKTVKYEYNKELKLNSKVSKANRAKLLEKLQKFDLNFEKLSQAHKTMNNNSSRGRESLNIFRTYTNTPDVCPRKISDNTPRDILETLNTINNQAKRNDKGIGLTEYSESKTLDRKRKFDLINTYKLTQQLSMNQRDSLYASNIANFVEKIERCMKNKLLSNLKELFRFKKSASKPNGLRSVGNIKTLIWDMNKKRDSSHKGIIQKSKKLNQNVYDKPMRLLDSGLTSKNSLKTLKKSVVVQRQASKCVKPELKGVFKKQTNKNQKKVTFLEINN